MWIALGKLLMLAVWGFFIWNLVQPFPSPIKHFVNIAMIFMIVMHGLQLLMLKTMTTKDQEKLKGTDQLKIFIFGVFELLLWQKKSNWREKITKK